VFDSRPAVIKRPAAVPNSTGRRAALAEWIASPENPLTARVLVNRIWQRHIGRGIVATPSDFGKLGLLPSHPELLDWLAARFMAEGWSLKSLHRLIVTSAAYRQASTHRPAEIALMRDPENRLLWRMRVRRLNADQIHDALFAATGELDFDAGGPSVDGSKPRRSIYTKVKRNTHDPLLEAFDAPDNIGSTATRNLTTTPTQALLLFNSPLLARRAQALHRRITSPEYPTEEARIQAAYRLTLGREPESWELADLKAFLERQSRRIENGATGADASSVQGESTSSRHGAAALEDLCHVLLNANEFLYVD
jgi:hypothetical protein